jgi:hypothetical protein
MKIFFRIIIITACYTGLSQNILSATWAILPAKFENVKSLPGNQGPVINPENPDDGWEIAKLFKIYLNSNYIYTILPVQNVKNAFIKNKIRLNANLTEYDLQKLGDDIGADKLLMTRIVYSPGKYTIKLQMFFTQSNQFGESVSFSGDNLFYVMGEALKNQFQVREEVFTKNQERLDFIFGIDASGKNYNEIQSIPDLIRDSDINSFSGVSVDGYGKTLVLKNTGDRSLIYNYLGKIKPQSIDPEGKLYPVILEQISTLTQTGKSHIIFLFVSGAPASIENRQKTNGYIRKLSHKYNLVIFGNGRLTPAERYYWTSLSSIHKSIHYSDILYSISAGLSDGSSVYLIKSGDKLLESNINEVENAHEIELTTDQKEKFLPENIINIFEEAAYKQTVSHSKTGIKLNLNPYSNLLQYKVENISEKKIKILLTISEKPFWIKIPYYQTESGYTQKEIIENENYFFLLNLTEGGYGIPLRNSPSFGRILDPNDVSRIILLDINQYLKFPQNYLEKSLGGSSLYIIYGKVKEIEYEKKILY